MTKENVDVVGGKPVKNGAGKMSMSQQEVCSITQLPVYTSYRGSQQIRS